MQEIKRVMNTNYTLLPQQKQAVEFAKGKNRVGLAMDMRTGKTLSTLHILLVDRGEKDILVVCPSKGKGVWQKQLKDFFGMESKTIDKIEEAKNIKKIEGIMITSPKVAQHLNPVGNASVVVDEVHKMRGGQQFSALKYLCDKAKNVVVLSGTPAVKRPSDLYSPLRLLHHWCAYKVGGEKYDGRDEKSKYSFLGYFCYSGSVYNKYADRHIALYNGLSNCR